MLSFGGRGRVALLLVGTLAPGGLAARRSWAADAPDGPTASNVRVAGHPAAAVFGALEGARQRLAQPACRALRNEFRDPSGRSLAESLEASGRTAEGFLYSLFFYDGGATAPCQRRDVLAFTRSGSRVIHVCAVRLQRAHHRDPRWVEGVILHEMLHSLGLGENPPTPGYINQRILESCPVPESPALVAGRD